MNGLLGRLGRCLPLSWLQPGPGGPLFLPFYHLVSDEPAPHVRHLYPVCSTRRFRSDLEWILRHFEPVGLTDLGKTTGSGKPVFHLSFDDGLRQCSEVVAPILLEMGVPATFFINPNFVDNVDLMYRYKASLLTDLKPVRKEEFLSIGYFNRARLDELAVQLGLEYNRFLGAYRPYMSTSQLEALVQQGFTLGGHSMDHPMYWDLDLSSQLQQTVDSVHWVQSRWSMPAAFAFPFTDVGVAAGYFTGLPADWKTFGTAGYKMEREVGHFQRVPMEAYTGTASKIVPGVLLLYQIKRLLGRNWAIR